MSELLIIVGLKAKPGREGPLRRDLSDLVELSRKEDGNINYELSLKAQSYVLAYR